MIPNVWTDEIGFLDLVRYEWLDIDSAVYDTERGRFSVNLGVLREGPYDNRVLTVTRVKEMQVVSRGPRRSLQITAITVNGSTLEMMLDDGLRILLSVDEDGEVSILSTRPLSGAEPIALSLSGCLLGLLKGLAGRKFK